MMHETSRALMFEDGSSSCLIINAPVVEWKIILLIVSYESRPLTQNLTNL